MSRLNVIVLALGGFAIATSLPYAVRAQSGDALAHAEATCVEQGVGPRTIPFEACVGRAARAYDLGAPEAATAEAHTVSDASKACLSNDVEPMTLDYRLCMANEADRLMASRDDGR